MSEPIIIIDPNEELQIVLRIIYYNVPGFYYNPRKIQKISLLIVDGVGEFKGTFVKGMKRYNVPIRVVNLYSFESLVLVKKFKQDLVRLIFKIQYAIEGKLKEGECSKL
ncbi:11112_t:CDS:2 [Dentiscutata heterogama]|uniref:11112_t:CDS:1 n=1 Tax=Dentiscutata heterogama TaxID=1316150 RepID=A0ACA9KL07_9GLOM|nr:11112_t:CDS:2 [Dentiscutata heterogama]